MASSTSHQRHDAADGILRPRPLKPGNPGVLRAQGENGNHRAAMGKLDMPGSGISSGRSTPLPPDAPPSAISISSAPETSDLPYHRLCRPTFPFRPQE
ncbi:MAG: hypothetical protein Q9228_007979 [Teloschistes exilis]